MRNNRNKKNRESWIEKFFLRDLPNAWVVALYKALQSEVDNLTDDLNGKKW